MTKVKDNIGKIYKCGTCKLANTVDKHTKMLISASTELNFR